MRTILFAATLAVGLSACGGTSTSTSTSPTPPKPPATRDAFTLFAQQLVTLYHDAVAGNCAPVKHYDNTSMAGFGIACDAKGRRLYRGFRVTGAQQFGTGGAIDFVDAQFPRGGTIFAAVDLNRRWGMAISLGHTDTPLGNGVRYAPRQVGTRPIDVAGQTRAAEEFVAAVRNADCHKYFTVGYTLTSNEKRECSQVFFRGSPFRADFRSDPKAKPVLLGGVQEALFFGFLSGKRYRTLISVPGVSPNPYVIVSVHGRS